MLFEGYSVIKFARKAYFLKGWRFIARSYKDKEIYQLKP